MTILESVKAASLKARKNKDTQTSALLSTLLSDAQMVGKNDGNRVSTEGEVIAVIKKYISNINETKMHLVANSFDTSQLEQCAKDVEVLTGFLPSQLTVSALEEKVKEIISSLENVTVKDLGKVMKRLKELYDGQYDAKVAAELIKAKLNAI